MARVAGLLPLPLRTRTANLSEAQGIGASTGRWIVETQRAEGAPIPFCEQRSDRRVAVLANPDTTSVPHAWQLRAQEISSLEAFGPCALLYPAHLMSLLCLMHIAS